MICTPLLAAYRVSGKRGALLSGVCGIVVHDHWKPYFAMDGVEHGLCNAHHLRELQALVNIEGEAWARGMQKLLRRANRAARIALDKDIAVPARLVALIERRYNEVIAEALTFHESQLPFSPGKRKKRRKRRIGHNLALRLRDHKCAVLRFLTDLEVGFTNNAGARPSDDEAAPEDLRGLPIREGGGELRHTILRSVITTGRKQGWDIIEALTSPSDRLITTVKCA